MKTIFFFLLFALPCRDSRAAASTDTVVSAPAVTGHPITLFGNPAVVKEPKKTAPPGLVKEVPAEFKGSLPKPVKKKKKRAAPPPPPEKKAEVKPPKRKLVPVSFYDKWEARRVDCVPYLGKVFIPVYDDGSAQGINLKWQPEPEPPILQYGYFKEHPVIIVPGLGRKKR